MKPPAECIPTQSEQVWSGVTGVLSMGLPSAPRTTRSIPCAVQMMIEKPSAVPESARAARHTGAKLWIVSETMPSHSASVLHARFTSSGLTCRTGVWLPFPRADSIRLG